MTPLSRPPASAIRAFHTRSRYNELPPRQPGFRAASHTSITLAPPKRRGPCRSATGPDNPFWLNGSKPPPHLPIFKSLCELYYGIKPQPERIAEAALAATALKSPIF